MGRPRRGLHHCNGGGGDRRCPTPSEAGPRVCLVLITSPASASAHPAGGVRRSGQECALRGSGQLSGAARPRQGLSCPRDRYEDDMARPTLKWRNPFRRRRATGFVLYCEAPKRSSSADVRLLRSYNERGGLRLTAVRVPQQQHARPRTRHRGPRVRRPGARRALTATRAGPSDSEGSEGEPASGRRLAADDRGGAS